MDRQTVYAGQVPLETDLLNTNRNVLVAIGKMLGDMLGSSTFATGLGCVATSPASMNVQVQPGQLYSLQNLDNTAYSSLAADTTHQIVKQGIMLDAQSFSCPAPTTAGYSINYLIEANYADVDTNAVVLPFYNASNPSQAFNGPGGNGQPSMTTRAGKVILTLKPGVAAATGSQITPAVDSGCVGLWVVTVAYGQSTITSSNISQYTGAPILPTSLLQSLITNNLEYGVDSGPANAVQATFPIAPSSVVDNQQFWVKIKNANTGATTFTPNPGVIGAAPVVGAAHQALQGGELVANGRALFVYRADIASYVLESCTGAAMQTGPATQSQHAPQMGQVTGIVGSARNLAMTVTAASATGTLTADEIVVQTALGGVRYCLSNFNKTVNLAATGAGGMDTGTAPASGYVALYAIYNPSAGISALLATDATSSVAPNVYGGVNMPAGYTASALVSVWPTNSSRQFAVGNQIDRGVNISTVLVLSSSATAPTSLSWASLNVSSAVPPNAKRCVGYISMTVGGPITAHLGIGPNAYGTNAGCGVVEQAINVTASAGGGSNSSFIVDIGTTQTIGYYCYVNSTSYTTTRAIIISKYEF
ncbi:hypothetical protein [Burkholderia multivorans]|uniref:hypothetical protein n=1 Tax=Burkholderia multivorans TaxID=87883 RepID=UPI0021C1ECD3|nr:hypothetical protein [Burkholderia multivorans]